MDEDFVLGLFVLILVVIGTMLRLFAAHNWGNHLQSSWTRLIVGNFLVLLFLLALSLVTGEIYYRFFYDTTDSVAYTKVSQRWFQRHWQLNSSNCRDSINYSLKLASAKRRVSFLGDSFTAGHGLDNVERRFANCIRLAHPEWEVHVLAEPGFDTGNELNYLEGCLRQNYQIDQVVLVYCLNDVGDLFPQWSAAVERFQAEAERSCWLRRTSYLVNTLYYRIAARQSATMKSYYDYIAEGYRGESWEQQRRRLRALREVVQSHGGRLMVVTFPFFQALGSDYRYQSVHDALNQYWRDLEVPHLDLLPIYRHMRPHTLTVNRFDPHPNEYANTLAAAAIDEFLKSHMSNVAPSHHD